MLRKDGGSGGRKRTLVRSSSSRSHHLHHSKRFAGGLTSLHSANAAVQGGSGSGAVRGNVTETKSPASMRRSIGMVLLGIMMISSLPPSTLPLFTLPSPLFSPFPTPIPLLRRRPHGAPRRPNQRLALRSPLHQLSHPQIWENHIRRSVAGISILLFIAAFHRKLALHHFGTNKSPQRVERGQGCISKKVCRFYWGLGNVGF